MSFLTPKKHCESIPHANSYQHDGNIPRAVVYCSFLPDVPINRIYVKNQLDHWKAGWYPSGDQWIRNHHQDNRTLYTVNTTVNETTAQGSCDDTYNGNCQEISQLLSTSLARRLAGWDDWEQ
jgi:hypothetical protein